MTESTTSPPDPTPSDQGSDAYFAGLGIVENPHEGPDEAGWDAGYMLAVQDEEGFEPDRDYLETIGGE